MGSAARISNGLRPQDPGGGEVRFTTYRDEIVALQPVDSQSTRRSVGLHSGAVNVSVVLVDVPQKRVDRHVYTGRC